MKEKAIHAIPIITYSKDSPHVEMTIRGIITATDISKNVSESDTVNDIIPASIVHVVHTNSSTQAAAKMMLRHKVHHMIVMDDGKIVGMISALDFVNLVAEHTLGA